MYDFNIKFKPIRKCQQNKYPNSKPWDLFLYPYDYYKKSEFLCA